MRCKRVLSYLHAATLDSQEHATYLSMIAMDCCFILYFIMYKMRNCFIVHVAFLPSMVCCHESIIYGLCGVEFDYHVRNMVAMNIFIHGLLTSTRTALRGMLGMRLCAAYHLTLCLLNNIWLLPWIYAFMDFVASKLNTMWGMWVLGLIANQADCHWIWIDSVLFCDQPYLAFYLQTSLLVRSALHFGLCSIYHVKLKPWFVVRDATDMIIPWIWVNS